MGHPIDGFRSLAHLSSILCHYLLILNDKHDQLNYSTLHEIHIIRLLSMIILCLFFVLSGISSGRWFVQQTKFKINHSAITIRFYFERLLMYFPITSIYYIILTIFSKFVFKHSALSKKLNDCFFPSIFFLSNYICSESNVSYFGFI